MNAQVPGGHEFSYDENDFEQVRQRLYRRSGISLAASKQQMVYSRLARRLRQLDLSGFSSYLAYLDQHPGEWQHFINALTTNITAFFREPHHFAQLAALAAEPQRRGRSLRFWSAASSTGEEPYSMAIALHQALGERARNLQIIASDIDTGVLETARRGVYPLERIAQLEAAVKKRYFQRGTGANAGMARVVPELRQMVEFRRINLLDADWRLPGGFDGIFCRNVMIYFDKTTQVQLLERMVRLLRSDGLFFAGHSESFVQASHVVKLVSRTVYRPVTGVPA
ncbi:CheR family methyltransferase [Pseudomonas sp. GCM10022186]|uniref:CheR family methyltransferase n=1 Tax=Pseudomonas sp. GCM10022186 TaxID=3252650 RepID=UPI0036156801